MHPIVLEQLGKVKIADLSHYDELKHEYFIPQYKEIKLEVGEAYIIELNQILLSKAGVDSLMMWNHGSVPEFTCLKVAVKAINGGHAQVSGIGYNKATGQDILKMWTGWLPIKEIKIVSKLS